MESGLSNLTVKGARFLGERGRMLVNQREALNFL